MSVRWLVWRRELPVRAGNCRYQCEGGIKGDKLVAVKYDDACDPEAGGSGR